MEAGGADGELVRLAIRTDRFLATVEVPPSLAPGVRSMLVDQLRPDPEPVGSVVSIGIDERIRVDGRLWDPGADQSIFDQLIYVLMQASLDADRDRLHLHVGLVAHAGHGLLVGGLSGSGKSTLIAQLVRGGFDYCTDERVAIGRDGSLSALEKPLSLVQGSFAVLGDLDPARTGSGASTARLWHVPASAVRHGSQLPSVPPLGAIALVEFRPGSAFESVAMHPATVARVLLSDCIDAERFGPDGALLVARLCASVPCISIIHGGGADVPARCADIVDQVKREGVADVSAVQGGSRPAWRGAVRFSAASVVGRARGISGAVVADRALVRTAGGDLVELDEMHTAWFLLLDGTSTLERIAFEAAHEAGVDGAAVLSTAAAIAEHLAGMGVVA